MLTKSVWGYETGQYREWKSKIRLVLITILIDSLLSIAYPKTNN